MNLLIQALDDLFVLQQAGEMQPIDRFHIYNTDSDDLGRIPIPEYKPAGTG